MKYKVEWTESVGYETTVEASSKEEAMERFLSGDWSIEARGTDWREIETDSIEIYAQTEEGKES